MSDELEPQARLSECAFCGKEIWGSPGEWGHEDTGLGSAPHDRWCHVTTEELHFEEGEGGTVRPPPVDRIVVAARRLQIDDILARHNDLPVVSIKAHPLEHVWVEVEHASCLVSMVFHDDDMVLVDRVRR